MNSEEEIRREINKRGGIINYNDLVPEMKEYFLFFKQRGLTSINYIKDQLPIKTKIDFDIIDDYTFNAFATGINNIYFIGINRGTIATLSLVFNRVFADKNLFSFIGNCEKESSNLPLLDELSLNYEYTVNRLSLFKPPHDIHRKSTSRLLTLLALDFILAHEIGHVLRGHIGYKFNMYNLDHSELQVLQNTNSYLRMANKSMEMDADTWAVRMLLRSELNRVSGKLPLPGPEWKEIYKMPGIVLTQFAFAISTVFRIYGDQRIEYSDFENESYPRPRLRFVYSMLEIGKHPDFIDLNKTMEFTLDKNGIPISLEPAYKMIEEAFNHITGKTSSTVSLQEALGEIGFNQINTLIEFWNTELRVALQKYSYLNLFMK